MRSILAIDLETCDPHLKELGSGEFRKDSKIIGISFADDEGLSVYLDVGHPGVSEETARKNWALAQSLLADPCPKVGTNIAYDLGHLINGYGVTVNGEIHDIAHAESLIDAYRDSYSLDAIANTYLGIGKEKTRIESFCEEQGWKGDARAHLWKMPHFIVEPYAKADTTLLLPILKKQLAAIEREELSDIYNLERQLHRVMLKMKANGLKLDSNKREEITNGHKRDYDRMMTSWELRYPGVNVGSTKQLAHVFIREGIPFDVSNAGKTILLGKLGEAVNPKRLPMIDATELFDRLRMADAERKSFMLEYPSITSLVLEAASERWPLAAEVERIRKTDKLINTFLDGYMVKYAHEGYLRPSFRLFATDEGGCVTRRLSSYAPNAQNLPSVKGSFNPRIRDIIVPEEGHWFGKIDYSSQEQRILANFAVGPMADAIRDEYCQDPHLDFHQRVADWTGLPRKECKKITFGITYGMGAKTLGKKNLWDAEYAYALYDKYVKMVPFVLATRERVGQVARQRGYVKTLLGCRLRFNDTMKKANKDYLMLNYLIQGGAALMLKKALVDAENAGIFNTLRLVANVHDEIDVNVPKTKEGIEAFFELQNVMVNAIPLKVPVLAEPEVGDSWGTVEACTKESMLATIA